VGDRIIDLSREAARQLGSDRAGLAKVRVRYLGPAPLLGPADGYRVASNAPLPTRTPPPAPRVIPASMPVGGGDYDPVLELAGGVPTRAAPAAAAPTPASSLAASPLPTAPIAPITTEALAPVTGSEILPTPIAPPPAAATSTPPAALPLRGTLSEGASNLRIQAGAFSSQANAQQAASRLAAAGPASVEAMQRSDGMTLYRVILPAPADVDAAYALRDKVAEYGFADARVVRTY
jgi:rare lipoprotein A